MRREENWLKQGHQSNTIIAKTKEIEAKKFLYFT